MSEYGDFAFVYDSLTNDVDYGRRAKYILKILSSNGVDKGDLLDLACGTGSLSVLFAREGFSVIGVDNSPEMLSVAREKVAEEGLDVLLLCQDMTELDLYGTVDAAVCSLDSLNHLTTEKDFKTAIEKTALFLAPGGIFVFDVNTPYKTLCVLSDNTFVTEENGVFCTWQNETDKTTLETHIYLDFFVEDGDGLYERFSEDFSEKSYTDDFIKKCLAEAGLELISVFDEMSFSAPSDESQRIFYVCKKGK